MDRKDKLEALAQTIADMGTTLNAKLGQGRKTPLTPIWNCEDEEWEIHTGSDDTADRLETLYGWRVGLGVFAIDSMVCVR